MEDVRSAEVDESCFIQFILTPTAVSPTVVWYVLTSLSTMGWDMKKHVQPQTGQACGSA